MKASEQYFPAMLFIMLYKVAPTFESVYWFDLRPVWKRKSTITCSLQLSLRFLSPHSVLLILWNAPVYQRPNTCDYTDERRVADF